MLNVSVLLEDSARNYGSRHTLVLGDRRMTYAEVNSAANRIANLLVSRNVKPGDKVALSCPNIAEFPIIYFGILKAGAVVVPLNVLHKQREVAYHLRDSEAKAYFCFEGNAELPTGQEGFSGFELAEKCEHFFVIESGSKDRPTFEGAEFLSEALQGQSDDFQPISTSPNHTAAIIYTSGTTGEAKGAELTHANIVLNVVAMNMMLENRPGLDTHIVALPLFHAFGSTMQMLSGFSMASTLILIPRFDAEHVINIMEKEDVTFFAGVPTMWWNLLHALHPGVNTEHIASNLRVGVSGGASLPVDIINQIKSKLGVTIFEGYGLSEVTTAATFNQPGRPAKPGSVGTPVWGVECKLIRPDWSEITSDDEIAEIAIRGPNVMKGYYNRPEETAEAIRDGWFRSGDLARRDSDGYYYIVDRSKDMIIRGGYNVYPREIEEVLTTHPDVSLAAVIGVPHTAYGEEIKAYVIRSNGSTISETELIAWVNSQVAAYKYPRIVEFVDSLPLTATGKILKRQLT